MITLSIVSHRQAPLVAALLEDVARIDSPGIAAIIVTINVPEPLPAWPAALADRIRVIANATPHGFGANHNAAFRHCTTDFFAVMNPDLRLPDDPFDKLVSCFARGRSTRLALVAPFIVDAQGVQEDSIRSLITPLSMLRRRLGSLHRAPADRCDWVAGMFMLLSSEAFKDVGGFDERYFMYCEDFDLCARVRLRGWDFEVVEDARVVHLARRASLRSHRHLRWHVASLLRMWTSSAYWHYRRLLAGQSSCGT